MRKKRAAKSVAYIDRELQRRAEIERALERQLATASAALREAKRALAKLKACPVLFTSGRSK